MGGSREDYIEGKKYTTQLTGGNALRDYNVSTNYFSQSFFLVESGIRIYTRRGLIGRRTGVVPMREAIALYGYSLHLNGRFQHN
jgi:hypothetical protein